MTFTNIQLNSTTSSHCLTFQLYFIVVFFSIIWSEPTPTLIQRNSGHECSKKHYLIICSRATEFQVETRGAGNRLAIAWLLLTETGFRVQILAVFAVTLAGINWDHNLLSLGKHWSTATLICKARPLRYNICTGGIRGRVRLNRSDQPIIYTKFKGMNLVTRKETENQLRSFVVS